MITKFGTELKRDIRGQIQNSISDAEVRKMHADYLRTGSLTAAARIRGCKTATLWALLKRRGLIQPRTRAALRRKVIVMYFGDYVGRKMSLEAVADKHGCTRQSVFGVFKARGLRLRKKEFLPAITYKGRKYTCQSFGRRHQHRYLRCTVGRSGDGCYLHHVIWIEHNGPIPPGHKICFKDGNHLNCAIENLELLTNSEQVSKYAATGHNQFTVTAGARLNLLLARAESGNRSTAADLKERAA